jgi:hypothetical protein
MRKLAAFTFVGVLIQFSVAITAQQNPTPSPTFELVSHGHGGLIALIEERSATTTTPFEALGPKNRCGSLAACKSFGTHVPIGPGIQAGADAHPFQRIWLIRVDPGHRPLGGRYQPDATYKLLSVAECSGPKSVCPEPGPTPLAPGPRTPGCGPRNVCPEPGPGKAIVSELESGQLVVTEEHSLSTIQLDYMRRLLDGAQRPKVQENQPR